MYQFCGLNVSNEDKRGLFIQDKKKRLKTYISMIEKVILNKSRRKQVIKINASEERKSHNVPGD